MLTFPWKSLLALADEAVVAAARVGTKVAVVRVGTKAAVLTAADGALLTMRLVVVVVAVAGTLEKELDTWLCVWDVVHSVWSNE